MVPFYTERLRYRVRANEAFYEGLLPNGPKVVADFATRSERSAVSIRARVVRSRR